MGGGRSLGTSWWEAVLPGLKKGIGKVDVGAAASGSAWTAGQGHPRHAGWWEQGVDSWCPGERSDMRRGRV